jgi:RNA polymerase sigma-70 factor (ECF subfamily)
MNEETIVRTYADMVYKIAYRYMGNPTDADDVFSETFLTYFKKERSFQEEEHRKAWLIRVTVNCCNSHFVAPWRKNVDCMDDYTLSQIPDEDNAIERSEDTDVYAQILRLPQSMREVIILFYYENMPIKEIAQTLGESEANIKKRLSRARQKLKLELE